jgi:hypothetical protein
VTTGYGSADESEHVHMTPKLTVLYSLVLAQGVFLHKVPD